jgi:hypothetical protein
MAVVVADLEMTATEFRVPADAVEQFVDGAVD